MVEAAATENADPLRISFKQALEELLDIASILIITPPDHVARVLLPRLLARIVSHRVPFRPDVPTQDREMAESKTTVMVKLDAHTS